MHPGSQVFTLLNRLTMPGEVVAPVAVVSELARLQAKSSPLSLHMEAALTLAAALAPRRILSLRQQVVHNGGPWTLAR